MKVSEANTKFEEEAARRTCFLSGVKTAVVFSPCTSDPANASEIARQMNLSPANTGLMISCCSFLDPQFMIQGSPMTIPPCNPSA